MQRIVGSMEEVTLDSQGRVTVPRFLKDYAEMGDQQMNTIVGTGSHVEFWKKSNLAAILAGYTDAAVSEVIVQWDSRATEATARQG